MTSFSFVSLWFPPSATTVLGKLPQLSTSSAWGICFPGAIWSQSKVLACSKVPFWQEKALKKLSICAISAGTQILMMGDAERCDIPKEILWSQHFQSQFFPLRTHFSEPSPKRVIPRASGPPKSELAEGLRDILITDLDILPHLSRVTQAIYPSAVTRDPKQKGSTGNIYCGDSEVV